MGTAAAAAGGDDARGRRQAAALIAVALTSTLAWGYFGLTQLAIGPSDWDDAMYCDRAATGSVAWDIRNRYVHVWGLRTMFALTPYRELGAQLYAVLSICGLATLALVTGWRIAGMRCGVLAMATTLLYPPLIKYLTVPHVDLTLALWMAAATLAAACASQATGRRVIVWAGVAGATTVLALKSKETALVLLPVLGVTLWPLGRQKRGALDALTGLAAGAALAALVLWVAHLVLDAPGSKLSSANFLDYFARRPVVPAFDTGQSIREAKLRHDLLSQLAAPAMLPVTLLGGYGLLTGFKRDPFLRALAGMALAVAAFTSYIAYASRNIQVEDRYIVALAVPLCIGAAHTCERLLRRVAGEEAALRDRPNLLWLLPLLLGLCALSGRGLWVWAAGGTEYSERAAVFFLLPVTTVALFATPFVTHNRWLPRAAAALLLLITATAGVGAARQHAQRKAAELAPWRVLAAAIDAGDGKLAVMPGGVGQVRVRFRLRSLSRRDATHLKIRGVRAASAVQANELLFDSHRVNPTLRAHGYRVVAFAAKHPGQKPWTAYAPPGEERASP